MINIFIDTNIYGAKNFNFDNSSISRLQNFIENEHVELFITPVIIKEIEDHIEQKVEGSGKQIKEFKQNAPIMINFEPLKKIWDRDLINQAKLKILDRFHEFLRINRVYTVPISVTYANQIIQNYLEGSAPFSKKKKKEFPDAFTMYTLLEWAEKNNEIICIISNDKEIRDFCEGNSRLYYIKTLEEAFDYINQQDDVKYQQAQNIYMDHLEQFLDDIDNEINEACFAFNIEVFDVEDVKVKDFSLVREGECYDEPRVLELEDSKLTFVLDVNFEFTIVTSKIDPTRSPYDSEEGMYLYIEYEETEYTEIVELPVELELNVQDYEKQDFIIESIKINNDEAYLHTINDDYF
ncbi:PIN domain-containing protein [Bacillus safensis]|uniref:PIN domain-containing protein n=1 Tax=Bacillus safensis TaxID=561879 RepID=UPI0020411CAD|nr:PIN domain-containing protein [Bacillus safensis]MCM3365946.1 PIN domain-containing protein [Bacillus safensis]